LVNLLFEFFKIMKRSKPSQMQIDGLIRSNISKKSVSYF
jgi:hypothetical protein